jgi:hypothetical protein
MYFRNGVDTLFRQYLYYTNISNMYVKVNLKISFDSFMTVFCVNKPEKVVSLGKFDVQTPLFVRHKQWRKRKDYGIKTKNLLAITLTSFLFYRL